MGENSFYLPMPPMQPVPPPTPSVTFVSGRGTDRHDDSARLSVLTATRNARTGLEILAADLRAQDCNEFEWIVIDAASTDGSAAFLRTIVDVSVVVVCEPDSGIYDALNKGLKLAKGSHYIVVGADDRLAVDAVSRYRTATAAGADIVSAPVRVGQSVLYPNPRADQWRSKPPFVSAHSVGSAIRTSLHGHMGTYDTSLPIAADTLFLLRAKAAGARFLALPMPPVGEFGSDGISSRDVLGAILESTRARIRVLGHPVFQLALMAARLVSNLPRIIAQSPGRKTQQIDP